MKTKNIFIKITDGISNVLAIISGIMILTLVIIVILEVFMRYIMHLPIGWSIEICEYLLLYITFMAAGWLLKVNAHVNVDLLYAVLSDKIQYKLTIISNIVGFISCMILFVYGSISTYDYYIRSTIVMQQLETPKWVLMLAIPIGGLTLSMQFGKKTLLLLYNNNDILKKEI
jgi:C4-dicarboxylate transporter, DctQ subunit